MESQNIKYIVLEQLLTENRVNQVKEKYKCIPPMLIDYMSSKDPSGNNKYLMWMTKLLWETEDVEGYNGFRLEFGAETPDCLRRFTDSVYTDIDRFTRFGEGIWFKTIMDALISMVTNFHQYSRNLQNKDINSYTYDSLKNALDPIIIKASEKELAKDVEKIYEDEDWLFISPKTHKASCIYGSNTRWCVTMRNDPQYYQRYTKDGHYLLFVIKKKENKKWAINTDVKLDAPSEDIKVELPWHKEIETSRNPIPTDSGLKPRERFRGTAQQQRAIRNIKRGYESTNTTYWQSDDDEINWEEFIEQSQLPEKLQGLLRAIQRKVEFSVARKKRGEIPYEVNPNPVRLKKGDKVKLLASGYGYFRGDEGTVLETYAGAPGRQKDVNPTNAGNYLVHVPGRKPTQGYNRRMGTGEDTVLVGTVLINGAYLQKIVQPKGRNPKAT
jgi:hypothetical protein